VTVRGHVIPINYG